MITIGKCKVSIDSSIIGRRRVGPQNIARMRETVEK